MERQTKHLPPGNKHGHMAGVGLIGLAAGLMFLVYVPALRAISKAALLVVVLHVVGALVLFASVYVLGGDKLAHRLRVPAGSKEQFHFGWAPSWTYGPWIAALVLGTTAVVLMKVAPAYWPLSLAIMAFATVFFAGGFVTRSASTYADAVLPMVDLLPNDDRDRVVLDAGSGSGRTAIALSRALKKATIVALDRFDSDYIEGGGRLLLEQNMRRAGLADRVRVQQGDLTALPFADQTFDAAVSAHAVDHLGEHKEEGLREIRRVLRPGGRFLLIVWVPGWTMFTVANVLSFFSSQKGAWRRMATSAGFTLSDEGMFNGNWFAVLTRPEAS